MRIKVNNNGGVISNGKVYKQGRVYDVAESVGRDLVRAGHAMEVRHQPESASYRPASNTMADRAQPRRRGRPSKHDQASASA